MTKLLLNFILFTGLAFGQTTAIPMTVTVPNGAIPSIRSFLVSTQTSESTTLSSGMLIGDTVANVTTLGTIAVGTAIVIEGESMLVTSRAGNALTVTRATLGTVAAAHAGPAAGQPGAIVNVQRWPTMVAMFQDTVRATIGNIFERNPTSTITAQRAAIAAAQAAIDAEKVAAVQ